MRFKLTQEYPYKKFHAEQLCCLYIFSKSVSLTSYSQKKIFGGQTPLQKIWHKRRGWDFYKLFLRLYLTYFNKHLFVGKLKKKTYFGSSLPRLLVKMDLLLQTEAYCKHQISFITSPPEDPPALLFVSYGLLVCP